MTQRCKSRASQSGSIIEGTNSISSLVSDDSKVRQKQAALHSKVMTLSMHRCWTAAQERPARTLDYWQVLRLLVCIRVIGATTNCIADCDETFN